MTDFDPALLASADPAQFTTVIKAASSDQLKSLMSGEYRGKILDEIFRRFPTQFRADRASGTNAVIHWHITDGPGEATDSYQVVIADGACTLSASTDAEPRLTVTIGGADFLRLISGSANPMMMFMTGKIG